MAARGTCYPLGLREDVGDAGPSCRECGWTDQTWRCHAEAKQETIQRTAPSAEKDTPERPLGALGPNWRVPGFLPWVYTAGPPVWPVRLPWGEGRGDEGGWAWAGRRAGGQLELRKLLP